VSTQVFINLPVADLPKSMAFFTALGYSHNPQFTGDASACIVVSDTLSVMLVTHTRFRDFTPKAVCDTSRALCRPGRPWLGALPHEPHAGTEVTRVIERE
jgi:predicted lactoylglutathione lyase